MANPWVETIRSGIKEMLSSEEPLDQAKVRDRLTATPPMRLPMKIFQIGFNKCGTRSIHRYLIRNGVSSVHWDGGRLAQRMYVNFARGDDLLAGYEEFDAFTDMEYLDEFGTSHLEGYKLYPYLAAQYPEAVFILNTRDCDAWIRSRLAHGKKVAYANRAMKYYGVTSIDGLTNRWRREWEQHHRRVTEFFTDKPHRFFVCRIEKDLPHILNNMLPECDLDACHYRLEGKTLLEGTKCLHTGLRGLRVPFTRWESIVGRLRARPNCLDRVVKPFDASDVVKSGNCNGTSTVREKW